MDHAILRINCARRAGLVVCAVLGATLQVAAQTPGGSTAPSVERRETIIGGRPTAEPTFDRCVDVQIGTERAFGCLNQKLRREVDRVNPSINLPPVDARSPDVRVGNVNEAAVRQQYGSNYGRSVIPFRPPVPTYVLPHR